MVRIICLFVTGSVPTESGTISLSFDNTEFFTATSGDDLILGIQYQEIELVTGENDQINVYDGGAGNDYILGGDRWEVLAGGDGDDYIEGGAGIDYIYWNGQGNDAVYDFNWGVDFIYVDSSFTGSPTYNAETSTVEFSGDSGTLTLNIEDPGTGLVDEENYFTDKWLEGVYTITDLGSLRHIKTTH